MQIFSDILLFLNFSLGIIEDNHFVLFLWKQSNITVMEARALTPVQEDLLKMFAFDHSDSFAKEIKKVLKNYLLKKIDEETTRLWDEGVFDQKDLDELRHEDLHKI